MNRSMFLPALLCLVFAPALFAQKAHAKANANPEMAMPSDAEIGELMAKASEKVEAFDKTLDSIKPILDQADSTAYDKDKDAIRGARLILGAIKINGKTAYALVSLLATLDDLDLDANQDSTAILLYGTRAMADGKMPPDGMTAAILMLTSAGSGLYDISELVMHPTLRFVSVEEAALSQLLTGKKELRITGILIKVC